MNLTLYQIDAFTDHLFSGNPAAVIPLDKFPDTQLMQNIANENNLAETAFFCPSQTEEADYDLRWFTPTVEIDLCGHATLASGFVLFEFLGYKKKEIRFNSKSGILTVTREDNKIWLDFPSWRPEIFYEYPAALNQALGEIEIVAVYKHRDIIVELNNEDAVIKCSPDFGKIKKTGHFVIITAPGTKTDFVSRFFAPTAGVDEDAATGRAHSQLIPFWSEKLGKNKMTAKQLSSRGADFFCEQKGARVRMGGGCVYYMKGEVRIKD